MKELVVVMVLGVVLSVGRVTADVCQLELDDPQHQVSVDEDSFSLKWKVSEADGTIDILLHSGGLDGGQSWFAFGLSESGGMVGSDIVSVEFGSSGSVNVADRYVPWVASPLEESPRPYPVLDSQQDWELVCSENVAGNTTALVRRSLDTGDDEEDRPFVEGGMSVIYAWGTGYLGYHGSNRGSIVIDFLGTSPSNIDEFVPPSDADDSIVRGFSPGYSLRPITTQYVCQVHDVGTSLRHIVAVEQVYMKEDYGKYVHHVLVHACGNDLGAILDNDLYEDVPFPCQKTSINSKGNSPMGQSPCTSLLYGGAVGGDPFVLPDIAGALIGSDVRYIIVEAHLDNPSHDTGMNITDIVKFHTTTTLRPHDAGSMVVGDPSTNLPTIPVGESKLHFETTCPTKCTSTFATDRHIFSSFLHMHQVGRTMWTSLLKYNDDKELVSKDTYDYREFWNFEFQQLTHVNVTLSPGDQINTHCIYDSTKRTEDVDFASDSSDEMCMSFLFYYPYQITDAYFCGYVTPYASICGQYGTPSFAVIEGVNPQPDGDAELPSEFYVSYSNDDEDGGKGLSMTVMIVIIIVVAVVSVTFFVALFLKKSGKRTQSNGMEAVKTNFNEDDGNEKGTEKRDIEFT